jgi:hypothetical protein
MDPMPICLFTKMDRPTAEVHFEEQEAKLTAVEIVRQGRSPLIVSLYPVLLSLGIVVSSYQARPSSRALRERIVVQRRDGGTLDANLSAQAKAAILPVVLETEEPA